VSRSFLDHITVTAFSLEAGAAFVSETLGVSPQAGVSVVTDLDVPMFTIDEGDWPRRTQSERRRGLMPAAFLR
jgi:hypothetical protein